MTTIKPGEFDHRRAWRKWAAPEFQCLPADVRALYEDIRDHYPFINQLKDLSVRWPTEEEEADRHTPLRVRFDNCPAEYLLKAIPIVYAYGHWSPHPNDGGAYWKFQSLAKQVLIEKNERLGWDLKWDIPKDVTERFIVPHPHEVDIDAVLAEGLVRHDVINCNHDPHPFMIGEKHFPRDGSMYIRPQQAPCAMRGCNLSYDEHTSDRVLVLRGLRLEDDKVVDEQQQILRSLAPVLEEHNIDGITFLKE